MEEDLFATFFLSEQVFPIERSGLVLLDMSYSKTLVEKIDVFGKSLLNFHNHIKGKLM